jgi:predicted nucleic acid-binding protein
VRVYVETNFVLELALEQEQHESCEQLLQLAHAKRIELVIPAYSLVEPHDALRRRHLSREAMKVEIDRELGLLIRSANYQERLEGFRDITDLLIESTKEETRRLERLRLRIVGDSTVLPLDGACLVDGVGYRMAYGLSPQDALLFAAVISHLDRSDALESCFLNRDRDFEDPDLVEALRRHRCVLIPSFDHGLQRVRSRLAATAGPAET